MKEGKGGYKIVVQVVGWSCGSNLIIWLLYIVYCPTKLVSNVLQDRRII